MKRFIAFIAIITMMSAGLKANAQGENGHQGWKDKIKSEKIAFLTMEMNITPEEAQAFWPIYNQVDQEKTAAFDNVIKTYKALNDAVEQNNAENIAKCLAKYLAAQEKCREIESNAPEKYKSVLPVEKVAKLYVAEENFRRQHIRNMRAKKTENQ